MKICFCLLITLAGLVLNIPAQSKTFAAKSKIIDSQKLFIEAAKRVLKNKGLEYIDAELEEYAYKANGRIYSLPKEEREREAALIMIELQAPNPVDVIKRKGKWNKNFIESEPYNL
jgi:hypothetical protein